MNDMSEISGARDASGSAFTFTGQWREFLPIALTNLALTIVTLGIYRFWAKARERRYLWSRTRFIDDTLEWTGTGKEMFFGFLIVMAVVVPALLVLNFGLEALILRGEFLAAGVIGFALYAGLFYLYHVARFRALRYQLSRTFWHGIRGGSDNPGWAYGLSGVWRFAVGFVTLGLLIPWAMTRLWNERWGSMSFGPHPFHAEASSEGLMGRWLLIYLAPVLGVILMGALGFAGAAAGSVSGSEDGMAMGAVAAIFFGAILFYVLLLILSLSFYALFYRHVVDATSVAGVDLRFTARTKDWLKLILGNIALVVVTLGVGLLFISYRNWSFLVCHMEAAGVVDLDVLTQTTTRAPTDAEGLADAFDFGAI
ncbi:MAG TPA: YjgN family protein [Allosphingosinicella sp.]|uniref:YjgN family protein n=1 Tax=Allosphingosinicella sp. TaxID=2823234 RepID=UPI002EDA3475